MNFKKVLEQTAQEKISNELLIAAIKLLQEEVIHAADVQIFVNQLASTLAFRKEKVSPALRVSILRTLAETVKISQKRSETFSLAEIINEDINGRKENSIFVYSQIETCVIPLLAMIDQKRDEQEFVKNVLKLANVIMSSKERE